LLSETKENSFKLREIVSYLSFEKRKNGLPLDLSFSSLHKTSAAVPSSCFNFDKKFGFERKNVSRDTMCSMYS